ncbi:radial spoke binding protein 15 [Musca autumnalis]|uniref:radial spoke binding protein 15 n=1 Tax=Musca autumnalis TaxID=221902 RepID=UPI003CF83D49
MSYLIQHGKIRSQTINVPDGLPELLSDITREVLRCQPTKECLCQFIIDYLHSLIVTREKARMAKMAIDRALRIVDEIVADMCICDIQPSKAEKMCEAMEECFKRFLAQRRCDMGQNIEIIKFNEIDMLDELIRKCKFSDDELKISRPIIEAAYQKFVDAYMTAHENMEGTEALYQYFREREMKRLEEHKRQEAAVKIQANFRGFLVRRSMFLPKDTEKEASDQSLDLLAKEEAARKIQRFFRHRIKENVPKDAVPAGEEYVFQDVCQPESKISLDIPAMGSNAVDQRKSVDNDNEQPKIPEEMEIIQAREEKPVNNVEPQQVELVTNEEEPNMNEEADIQNGENATENNEN